MPYKKYIKLSKNERELMAIFNQHPHAYINTVVIKDHGLICPSQLISSLKRKGAIFDRDESDFTSVTGRTYKCIAFFRFRGWCHD